MGSLSGLLQRPLSAAAAVAVAAVSSDIPDRFAHPKLSDPLPISDCSNEPDSWVSRISLSNISDFCSLASNVHLNHTTDVRTIFPFTPKNLFNPIFSSIADVAPAIHTLYHYAKITKPRQSPSYTYSLPSFSSPPSEVIYKWHLPDPHTIEKVSDDSLRGSEKSQTVVVLLGWLGAKQKQLKRYADWYTSRGFNVVTFTYPMGDVLNSYKVGGDAEKHLELLANHLAEWITEEYGKKLVFHTFSNTGWLTYGAILDKFQKQNPSLMENIKGCIVDSAPSAAPDPQVWALGFSTALLKKQSVGTKGPINSNHSNMDSVLLTHSDATIMDPKPEVVEVVLLLILEKIFKVVLNLPSVNRRLSDVVDVLSNEQPKCPQLYIYSSSDRVIPVKSVESFIEQQRRVGHEVRACDFVSSPHVDHFRNHPNLYTSQLTTFLENSAISCCKGSS